MSSSLAVPLRTWSQVTHCSVSGVDVAADTILAMGLWAIRLQRDHMPDRGRGGLLQCSSHWQHHQVGEASLVLCPLKGCVTQHLPYC